ncbi:FAD-dependent monooxygenase [Paracoccus tegillarcae]|uniref:Monooxygenase n=1 Tax=Paracoccus tegillarcae TaxID=1529068 RepID=A0A2K9EPX1_9RHOB|nr:FAD-dependent monooxygenase [Paracoccus tegillarcae]AUH35537.1 monooxygenase [Paracoccus tegillarcae]
MTTATIIGGGVAGLTAALALVQRGASVNLFERAAELTEVGAGLQLSPNAGRVLEALGLGPALDAVSIRSRGVRMWDARARPIAVLDFASRRPDARFRMIHRARLIEVLAKAVQASGATIRLSHVVDALPRDPLVIGADGLHSRVRQALNGTEVPYFSNQTAWRALISDPEPPLDGQGWVDLFLGPRKHLVSYPLAGGLRNIVAVAERYDWQAEGWSHKDDPANLQAAFVDFGGPVANWLARIEDTGIWGLFRHPVAPRWHDDSRVLIGDAAHPTLPFMAQGAALAIEDAWLLAACLDQISDQPSALMRFQQMRAPRATRIVALADQNARHYHLKGPKRIAAQSALRLMGRLSPERLVSRFDWIYDYDPVSQSV